MDLVGRDAEDVGGDLARDRLVALPCGTVPIVRTISPKMSSLIVATSLFPRTGARD
jgi:hypothetical protein